MALIEVDFGVLGIVYLVLLLLVLYFKKGPLGDFIELLVKEAVPNDPGLAGKLIVTIAALILGGYLALQRLSIWEFVISNIVIVILFIGGIIGQKNQARELRSPG